MHQIVYISTCPSRDEPFDAEAILRVSRRNNTAAGITGVLVFSDGIYFQVLEGEREKLESLFASIRRDVRHSSIIRLLDRPIAGRMFPDWSMGWHRCPSGGGLASDIRQLRDIGELQTPEHDKALTALITTILGRINA